MDAALRDSLIGRGYSQKYIAAVEMAQDRFRELWGQDGRTIRFSEGARRTGIEAMPPVVKSWASRIVDEQAAEDYDISYSQLCIAWFSVYDEQGAGGSPQRRRT